MTEYLFLQWFHLSCSRDQLRICQSTKCTDQGAQKFIMLWTLSKVPFQGFQVKLIWCQKLVFFVPWHSSVKPPMVPPAWPLASFSENINSASCPAYVPYSIQETFLLKLARLKLMLGSCSFTRCWNQLNVGLLRLKTLALRCQTVQGTRQRQYYWALAVPGSPRR